MKNIVLTGFRATGKTSIGKRLAAGRNLVFYDTDEMIRTRMGMSIARIVDEKGWACFREAEKAVIRDLADSAGAVISLGGGAVLDPENVRAMKMNGILVWLIADVPTVIARMGQDADSDAERPPLQGRDSLEETAGLLAERAPIYRAAADWAIDTNGRALEDIVAEIDRFFSSPRTDSQIERFNTKEG